MKISIRVPAAVLFLFTTLGAQCHTSPTALKDLGLVQTVRIEPAEPRPGDTITIRTEVTNRGPKPKWGTFMTCALGFGGELALSEVPGTARCLAVSFERQLAPGESIEAVDSKVVDSPAGTYVLEVQFLIRPEMTQRITVRVLGE